MRSLATRLFGRRDQFYLTRSADEDSVRVTVNGIPSAGFRYDARSNSVRLSTPPPAGAYVTVSYDVVCR